MLLEIFSVALIFSITKISTSSIGMTGDGSAGGRSNSGGGSGPCRGHPEVISLFKTTGFAHQQI